MALTLPYPDLTFVPLDVLTADELNNIVANYTYIAQQFPIASANIGSGAVGSTQLASAAVTADKLASSAVTSAKIAYGAVGVSAIDSSYIVATTVDPGAGSAVSSSTKLTVVY